ncbi:hypothetical protein V6N13_065868 [Hibiscus sabdariffa]
MLMDRDRGCEGLIAFKLEDGAPTEISASDVHSTLLQKTWDKGLHIKTVLYNSLTEAYNKALIFDPGGRLIIIIEQLHINLQFSVSEEVSTIDPALLDVHMVADNFVVVSCMRCCNWLLYNVAITPGSTMLYWEFTSGVLMGKAIQPCTNFIDLQIAFCHKDITKLQVEVTTSIIAEIEATMVKEDMQVAFEDVVDEFILKWARVQYPKWEGKRGVIDLRSACLICLYYMTCMKFKKVLDSNDFDNRFSWKNSTVLIHENDSFEFSDVESAKLVNVAIVKAAIKGTKVVIMTDLAQKVVNEIAESMMPFNTNYKDTRSFEVYVSAKLNCLDHLSYAIMYEITTLAAHCFSEADVICARNQLMSTLMLNIDGSSLVAEDFGHQQLIYDERILFVELFVKIVVVDPSTVEKMKRNGEVHKSEITRVTMTRRKLFWVN